MALPIKPPVLNESEGIISCGGVHLGGGVYFLKHAGVPTGGDGWANTGTLVIDITNKDIYMNTNTKASPTWTKVVD